MTKSAWVFPGQGSQFVGMGRELYDTSAQARALFDAAGSALEVDLKRLCFEGPEAELTDTVNAQPAILVHSLAALETAKSVLGESLALPAFTAGHSLGEYSALVAAGAIAFLDAVKLVRARGEAMKRAGQARPGAMAALLGLADDQVAAICAEAGGVQAANYNAPGQIVISGEREALERAVALAKKAGAKRAIPLAVTIASHSELMRPAVEEFRAAVEATTVQTPRIPVISNITGEPLKDAAEIKSEMLAQLTSPVQWVKSVRFMADCEVQLFVEWGPKDVLAGLIRRIAPGRTAMSIGNLASVNSLLQAQTSGG